MEEQRESIQTRPLFDKACEDIRHVLETGSITDHKYLDAVMQVFTGHIKIVNAERSKDALRFAVNSSLAENKKELKQLISASMPEFTKNLMIK